VSLVIKKKKKNVGIIYLIKYLPTPRKDKKAKGKDMDGRMSWLS
jgi:hypothetical protein